MAQTEYIFLGFPQKMGAPSPPAIPTIELSPFLTIEDDGANVTMMKLTSHTGTHMDAPFHVIEGGKHGYPAPAMDEAWGLAFEFLARVFEP